MNSSSSRPSTAGILMAFFAVYFIWGTTYLASLFGLDGLKPFVLCTIRYLTAGVLLAIWVVVAGKSWPKPSSLRVLVISGIVMLVGGSGLVVYGEQYINSGYAAVVVATEPLWFVLFDRKRWTYYFSHKKMMVGLITGFTGIILFAVLSPDSAALRPGGLITGTLIVLVSAVLWVGSTLYFARNMVNDHSRVGGTAVQLFAGGIFSALLAAVLGEWNHFQPMDVPARAWAGVAYLVLFGSIIAYVSFNWLVTVKPPALVSTHTFVNPVVALLIGWAIGGEEITFSQSCALAVVLTGVIITQLCKEKLPVTT